MFSSSFPPLTRFLEITEPVRLPKPEIKKLTMAAFRKSIKMNPLAFAGTCCSIVFRKQMTIIPATMHEKRMPATEILVPITKLELMLPSPVSFLFTTDVAATSVQTKNALPRYISQRLENFSDLNTKNTGIQYAAAQKNPYLR